MAEQLRMESDQQTMEGMYLTFDLAEEGYGLEISHVIEIIGVQPVTAVPDMPEHVIGVLNLRGKVIPIIDVRRRFHLPPRDYDERTCIIVIRVDELSVGLVVDRVSEVVDIPHADIEPAPNVGQTAQIYISGIAKLGDQVKILLDAATLLDEDGLAADETQPA